MGGNDRVWNLRFYRDLNDWELGASFSFLQLIQCRIPRGIGSNSLYWGLNGSKKFVTRSFYHENWMSLLPFSLERAFGKQRFLKGWRSLCRQQLMVRSLLWIILGYEAEPW